MASITLILTIIALACFLCAAAGATLGRLGLTPLGLLALTLAMALGGPHL